MMLNDLRFHEKAFSMEVPALKEEDLWALKNNWPVAYLEYDPSAPPILYFRNEAGFIDGDGI